MTRAYTVTEVQFVYAKYSCTVAGGGGGSSRHFFFFLSLSIRACHLYPRTRESRHTIYVEIRVMLVMRF